MLDNKDYIKIFMDSGSTYSQAKKLFNISNNVFNKTKESTPFSLEETCQIVNIYVNHPSELSEFMKQKTLFIESWKSKQKNVISNM